MASTREEENEKSQFLFLFCFESLLMKCFPSIVPIIYHNNLCYHRTTSKRDRKDSSSQSAARTMSLSAAQLATCVAPARRKGKKYCAHDGKLLLSQSFFSLEWEFAFDAFFPCSSLLLHVRTAKRRRRRTRCVSFPELGRAAICCHMLFDELWAEDGYKGKRESTKSDLFRCHRVGIFPKRRQTPFLCLLCRQQKKKLLDRGMKSGRKIIVRQTFKSNSFWKVETVSSAVLQFLLGWSIGGHFFHIRRACKSEFYAKALFISAQSGTRPKLATPR